MDYKTLSEHKKSETGIFEFLRSLPSSVFSNTHFKFITPSEMVEKLQPVSTFSVLFTLSPADQAGVDNPVKKHN